MADGDPRIVLLAGASGLTGARALDALLEAPDIAPRARGLAPPAGARALASRQPHRAIRAHRGAAEGHQLRGGAVLPGHDACARRARRRPSARWTWRPCSAFARAAETASARRFVVISSVGRQSCLAQFLPAHQGGDGGGARGAGLRVARHPAALDAARLARRDAAARTARGEPDAARESAAGGQVRDLSRHLRVAPSARRCSVRRAPHAAACSAIPTPASRRSRA